MARAAPGDGGRKACEMIGRLPEAGFGPGGGAGARGGGQTIATGRSRAAKGRARAGGPAQTGADIIETEGGRELGKAQADDVTPRWERAGVFRRARGAGPSRHQMMGHEIAERAEDGERGGVAGSGNVVSSRPCGR